ncbi:MAG: EI24 domain-containing protein [Deltaproteobacteria bacterium]|nr:EI24 domain-containing protein [Deltaproteobacteria bacterium]
MADPTQPYAPAPAATAAAPAAPRPPRLSKFRAGLKGPFHGLSFILRNPQLWVFAMIPVAAALVVFFGLSTLSFVFLPRLIEWIVGTGTAWYAVAGVIVLKVLAVGTAFLLSLLIALGLAQPLSGPALERLVRAMERDVGAPDHPKVPFWKEVARSAAAAFWTIVPVIPVLTLLFIVDLFVPFSWIVTIPLKIIITGLAITWDLLDYPFSVRGWRLGLRADWMKDNFGAALGFAISLGALCLLPCVHLLLLPAGAVGATWLINHLEGADDKRLRPALKPPYGDPPALPG